MESVGQYLLAGRLWIANHRLIPETVEHSDSPRISDILGHEWLNQFAQDHTVQRRPGWRIILGRAVHANYWF